MSTPTRLELTLKQFPRAVVLADDSTVEFRIVSKADRACLIAFGKSLQEHDLLFLRVDLSKAKSIDNWLKNIATGVTLSLVAYSGEQVVGYATVDRSPARWTRRVGELRVNVAESHRKLGLGRALIGQIFDISHRLGVKKLIANMTVDQLGAQAAFKRLGFHAEALLADHVEDRDGGVHDLVIMSYDMDGLTQVAESPFRK